MAFPLLCSMSPEESTKVSLTSKPSADRPHFVKWLTPLVILGLMLLLSLFFSIYQLNYNKTLQIQNYQFQNNAMAQRLSVDLEQGNVGNAVNQTNNLVQDKRITKMVIFDQQLNQIHSWPFSQKTPPPNLNQDTSLLQKDYWLKQDIVFNGRIKGYLYTQISFEDALFHAQKSLYFGFVLSLLFTFLSMFFISCHQRFYRQFVQQLAFLMREFKPNAGTHPKAHKYYPLEMFQQDFEALLQEVKTREMYQNETVAQLEKRKAFAETIIETVQHSLVVLDKTLCIKRANQAFYNLIEDQEDDIIDLFLPEFIPQILEQKNDLELIFSGEHNQYSNQLTLTVNNKTKHIRFTATRLNQIGHASQLLLALEDITSEITSARQTQLAAKMFQANRNAVLILDRRNFVQMSNPAMLKLLQLQNKKTNQEIRGELQQIIPDPLQLKILNNILSQPKNWQSKEMLTINNVKIPFEINYTAIFDKRGEKEYSILQLIDLRDSYQIERLEKLALHDELTGLPNRAHLMQSLERTQINHQHKQQNYAVAFLDLDGFKQVNDTYGHDAGDLLLQQTAKRLRDNIRQTDLAARLAGDEFVLVLKHCHSIEVLQKLAQKLLTALTQPCRKGKAEFSVSASIGIFFVTRDTLHMDINQQLKLADEAMYQAKQAGKNQVIIR
ncbi:GGDEF domain-containing protein [Motilimonas sp. 1_MG-2023]|nr:GGDEF domain-containing protein [Motilimonas sp. 1_MG-2023]